MNGIAWMIVFCEIAFWVVIVLGLAVRYVFKRHTLGLLFLALTPVIDLILLAATGVDLYRGASATAAHGIAAVYIGISIAYGKQMIQWADEKFQYYVTKRNKTAETFWNGPCQARCERLAKTCAGLLNWCGTIGRDDLFYQ